jgi:hypothetical protein
MPNDTVRASATALPKSRRAAAMDRGRIKALVLLDQPQCDASFMAAMVVTVLQKMAAAYGALFAAEFAAQISDEMTLAVPYSALAPLLSDWRA